MQMLRIRICLTLALCMLVLQLGACKNKKDIGSMSDDELVALELDDSLSPAEKERQIAARRAILDRIRQTKDGDAAIAQAMSEAHDLLSESSWQALQQSQQNWTNHLRGTEINRLVAEGVPAADAFGRTAAERADWISLHTSWALLVDLPGEIGGYYHAEDGRTLEIYEMPDTRINLVWRDSKRSISVTATGKYENKTALLHAENEDVTLVRLICTEPGKVTILATDDMRSAQQKMAVSIAEGVFVRYNTGEIDVFAP